MISEELQKRIQAAMDAQFTKAFYGTATAASAAPQEPLTVDTIRRAMLKLPKPRTYLASRLFPHDSAYTVEGGSEIFTVSHPSFWERAEQEWRRHLSDSGTMNRLFGMDRLNWIEIDPWPDDNPETAKWRAEHWDRLREAFEVAMQPLPEWLRSAPQFGKHG